VKINRDPKLTLLPFIDYFQGFEEAPPVNASSGGARRRPSTQSRWSSSRAPLARYSRARRTGTCRQQELHRRADLESIYSDVILCLNFLKRAAESSTASPTVRSSARGPHVLESYKAMVKEARRIGTPRRKISERPPAPAGS